MKARRVLLIGTVVVLVLGITSYATSAVAPQRSASEATVVPPASFVGTSGANTLVGSRTQRQPVWNGRARHASWTRGKRRPARRACGRPPVRRTGT